jgi:hypothetical protein
MLSSKNKMFYLTLKFCNANKITIRKTHYLNVCLIIVIISYDPMHIYLSIANVQHERYNVGSIKIPRTEANSCSAYKYIKTFQYKDP